MAGVNVSVAPEIINWVIEKIQFGTVNNSVFELLNKWKSGECKQPLSAASRAAFPGQSGPY